MIALNNKKNISERIIKYILMGLTIMIITRYLPKYVLKTDEIFIIGLSASITFAILDMISPTIKIIEQKK